MNAKEAADCLEHTLTKDPAGRYAFVCRKAFVLVKLYGNSMRMRFSARDNVTFRADADRLVVEARGTGAVRKQIRWEDIECIACGEPETDHGSLFQG